MASETDRHEPLREATPEVPDRQAPTHNAEKGLGAQEHVAAEHELRDKAAGLAAEEPARPTAIHEPSPGWTDKGGMVEQQHSAMEWVKASHERRQRAQEGADLDAPAPQDIDKPRSLAFYEDKAQDRHYGSLKAEHAESVGKESGKERQSGEQRTLTFNEDHDRDQGLTR